jgi:hypothetical protein
MQEQVDWRVREAQIYAGYLVVQAILGIVLWFLIATSATVRDWFELVESTPAVTDSFVFADIGLVVVGSLLSAFAIWYARPWATVAISFTAGAVMYPTLYLVVWVGLEGTASVALAVMVWTASATSWICWQTYRARG